jgi:hypothetical protein
MSTLVQNEVTADFQSRLQDQDKPSAFYSPKQQKRAELTGKETPKSQAMKSNCQM